MNIGGIDPVDAIIILQNQMLRTLNEIERQPDANICSQFFAVPNIVSAKFVGTFVGWPAYKSPKPLFQQTMFNILGGGPLRHSCHYFKR